MKDINEEQLKLLFRNFIELLNPAISTQIEMFNNVNEKLPSIILEIFKVHGISELSSLIEETSLNEININLNNGESISNKNEDIEELTFTNLGELHYINYINTSDDKENLLIYITLEGFEDDIKDIYLNSPSLSFLKYAMDCFFDVLRKELKNKTDKLFENNLGDILSSFGRDFINNIINRVCLGKDKNLFDEINIISTLNYEGSAINAKLLLIRKFNGQKYKFPN
ncbi:hypothetical protein [Niallia sp. BSM11]|uniref:hypothetical protein n=1 Tax=Niallia sp. BSM11 TaxID=3391576 RepID=UPI0039854C39